MQIEINSRLNYNSIILNTLTKLSRSPKGKTFARKITNNECLKGQNIKPVIANLMSIGQATQAYALLESGSIIGKNIFTNNM